MRPRGVRSAQIASNSVHTYIRREVMYLGPSNFFCSFLICIFSVKIQFCKVSGFSHLIHAVTPLKSEERRESSGESPLALHSCIFITENIQIHFSTYVSNLKRFGRSARSRKVYVIFVRSNPTGSHMHWMFGSMQT